MPVELIGQIVQGRKFSFRNFSAVMEIRRAEVFQSSVFRVCLSALEVGPGGAHVLAMQRETGASIRVMQAGARLLPLRRLAASAEPLPCCSLELPPSMGMKQIELSGTPDAIERVKRKGREGGIEGPRQVSSTRPTSQPCCRRSELCSRCPGRKAW